MCVQNLAFLKEAFSHMSSPRSNLLRGNRPQGCPSSQQPSSKQLSPICFDNMPSTTDAWTQPKGWLALLRRSEPEAPIQEWRAWKSYGCDQATISYPHKGRPTTMSRPTSEDHQLQLQASNRMLKSEDLRSTVHTKRIPALKILSVGIADI